MLVLEGDTRQAIERAKEPFNADSSRAVFDAGRKVVLMPNTTQNPITAEIASVKLRIAITNALDYLKPAGPDGGSGS
jgi:hypothetical protein